MKKTRIGPFQLFPIKKDEVILPIVNMMNNSMVRILKKYIYNYAKR